MLTFAPGDFNPACANGKVIGGPTRIDVSECISHTLGHMLIDYYEVTVPVLVRLTPG